MWTHFKNRSIKNEEYLHSLIESSWDPINDQNEECIPPSDRISVTEGDTVSLEVDENAAVSPDPDSSCGTTTRSKASPLTDSRVNPLEVLANTDDVCENVSTTNARKGREKRKEIAKVSKNQYIL